MPTLASLVARCRRDLRGSRREPFNRLADPMPVGQEFFITEFPVGTITADDYVCIGTELMMVTSVDSASNRVNVMRGLDDTGTADTHDAGAFVEVNWRWLTAHMASWLAEEIRSWPDEIFAVDSVEFHVPTSQRSVDLPLTRFRNALRVRARRPTREWVDMPVNGYRIELGLPTAEFPSGNAFIAVPGWTDVDVVLEYAQAFDLSGLEDLDTDTDTFPLSVNLRDVCIYGVAWRALMSDEVGRTDTSSQPEPRSADEVRSGDRVRSASAYKALRDQRLGEEQRRLRQLYPLKVQ